jgi:hypothetical protein
MGYLRELLCVMTADEISMLKKHDWKGNEGVMIQHLTHHRANENAEQELQTAKGFSRAYFDKLTSVLYGKCLALVAGNDIIEQLAFLGRRHLHLHIHHELKIHERNLLNGKLPISKTHFYLVAFKLCRQMGFEFYNPDKTWRFAELYLKSKEDKSLDDELQIELMHLSVYLQFMLSQGKRSEYEPKLLKQFAALQKKIEGKNLPKANYQYHCTLAWYHVHYTYEHVKIIQHLKLALACYEKHTNLFLEFDRVYVVRALAEAQFNAGNYENAFRLYSDLWEHHYHLVNTNYYHIGLYHELALIVGNKQVAEKLLKEVFEQTLKFEVVQSPRMGAYFQFAKFYLLQNKAENALEYINDGIALNDKNIMVLDELNLRMLQTACFVMLNDWSMAEQLISRHTKFLRLKNLHAPETDYSRFFKAMKLIIRYKQTGKIKQQTLAELTEVFQHGKAKVWGLILDKVVGD